MATGRVQSPDQARGIACILLVLYHAIGISPASGLEIESGAWRILADLLIYVRLPMFAFFSGYVYGLRPVSGSERQFILKKARRLLIPMVVVGILFVAAQHLAPGTHSQLPLSYDLLVYPIGTFWFIESLFIIFAGVVVLEKFELLKHPLGIAIAVALSIVLQLTVDVPRYFSLWGAVYLFPYFVCGLACVRFDIRSDGAFYATLAAAIGAAGYLATCVFMNLALPERTSIAAIITGLSVSYLVIQLPQYSWLLSRIGRSAYAVFLFHPFFSAGTRIVCLAGGFSEKSALIVLVTCSGVIGPVLLEWLIRRSPLASMLLLGDPWVGSYARAPAREARRI
jgi:fucose 4-O-acetylase-like acetyltransferase